MLLAVHHLNVCFIKWNSSRKDIKLHILPQNTAGEGYLTSKTVKIKAIFWLIYHGQTIQDHLCHQCVSFVSSPYHQVSESPARFSSKPQEELSSVLEVTALEYWEDDIKNVTLSNRRQELPAQTQVAYQEGLSLGASGEIEIVSVQLRYSVLYLPETEQMLHDSILLRKSCFSVLPDYHSWPKFMLTLGNYHVFSK